MKKIILLVLIAFLGCKKDNNGEPDLPLNTFVIGGTSYTAAIYVPKYYWQVAANQQTIGFRFRNQTAPAGNYRVTPLKDTGMDAVTVEINIPISGSVKRYYSTGSDNKELSVKYEGGRMFITLPKVWVGYYYNVVPSDSIEVSAYLKEWL